MTFNQPNMNLTALRSALFALLAAIMLPSVGCTTYTDYSSFLRDPMPIVTASEYRMAPPDVVLINSKLVRELDGHREQIRPDGKITLPLMGSVFVAGRTTEDVSAQLTAAARDYYEDAEVTLRVIGYNSKQFFVFGEVSRPGPYQFDGANTILETLAFAQPTRLADPTRIHVLRPSANGEVSKRMTINLDKMVKEGDVNLNSVLEEGDIIYVPANGLATVGLAIQQLLLPIQPAASTVQAPTNFATSFDSRPYSNTGSTDGL